MTQIVPVNTIRGEARVSSRDLAAALGNQHKNVLSLMDDYRNDFEDLGGVAFETPTLETPGGKQKTRVALLNENQCYLLLTMVRNTDQIVALKKELVKAFARAREQAQAVPALPTAPVGMEFLQQFAGNVLVAIQQQATATKDEVKTELRQEIAQALADRPIQGSQPAMIQGRIKQLAKLMGGQPAHYSEAWRRFKNRFEIAAYRDLLAGQFDDAIHFLDLQIASYDGGNRLLEG